MNYIKHLTVFFEKVVQDKALNSTDISLYMVLFQLWNYNRFKNPINISRYEVMKLSKIYSRATYHKCMKNLHSGGYIQYQPSYNSYKGTKAIMNTFDEEFKLSYKNKES